MWRLFLDLLFGYVMYKIIKFLALNLYLPALQELIKQICMKLKLSIEEFDRGLEELSKKYLIFAPRTFEKRGTYSDTDTVRYAKVKSFAEMNWEDKSHFPAKEALLAVNEVLFYLF